MASDLDIRADAEAIERQLAVLHEQVREARFSAPTAWAAGSYAYVDEALARQLLEWRDIRARLAKI